MDFHLGKSIRLPDGLFTGVRIVTKEDLAWSHYFQVNEIASHTRVSRFEVSEKVPALLGFWERERGVPVYGSLALGATFFPGERDGSN